MYDMIERRGAQRVRRPAARKRRDTVAPGSGDRAVIVRHAPRHGGLLSPATRFSRVREKKTSGVL